MPTKAVNYEEFGGKLPGEVLPGEQPRESNTANGSDRDGSGPTSTLRIVGAGTGTTATMGAGANVPSAGPPLQVTVGGQPGIATTSAPAAATNQPTQPAAVPPGSSASTRPEYAFTPDYTALSGRLEYSRTSKQWKLRYIPIDGKTDAYGGSVVLPNSPELAAFKSGDRVAVRGRLAGGPSAGSFSPLYQLEHVERMSP
jgi:hypothetical protein